MSTFPAFLIDHQLDQNTDERSIKRAYAKALKQIDQEHDLIGFQALRESYESALNWVQNKASHEAQVAQLCDENVVGNEMQHVPSHPSQESQSFTNKTQIEDAQNATNTTNEGCVENAALDGGAGHTIPLDTNRERASLDFVPDLAPITPFLHAIDVARHLFDEMMAEIMVRQESPNCAFAALRHCLSDDQMINVDVRDRFEMIVAHHLAQGWQSGNGDLFVAAAQQFVWDKDSSSLKRFEEVGEALDRAVLEMTAFNEMIKKRGKKQLDWIARARDNAPPTKQYLRATNSDVEQAFRDYPNWLRFTTDYGSLQEWMRRSEEYRFNQAPIFYLVWIRPLFVKIFSAPAIFLLLLFVLCGWAVKNSNSPPSTLTPSSAVFEFASANSSPEELYSQGQRYLLGVGGVKKNLSEAKRFFQLGAERGNLNSSVGLAMMYLDKTSNFFDPADAHRFSLQAAELGSPEAWLEVALDFDFGRGVAVDAVQAVYWYKKSVSHHNPIAMSNLAVIYETGKGIEKDEKTALDLYEQAAGSYDLGAMRNLAVAYLDGNLGIQQNSKEGLKRLFKIANRHDDRSQMLYGEAREYGRYGLSIDLEQAAAWYVRAKNLGNEEAQVALERVCRNQSVRTCKGQI